MAESLEDFESKDADRNIDQCSFQAQQFEIFTHDYREYGETACKDDEDGDHSKCKHADENSRKSKKELVNVTRKLQKALISLEMKEGSDVISDFLVALRDVNSRLRDAIVKDTSEFSTTTVTLPEYDAVDIQMMMGGNDDEISAEKPMLERIAEEQKKSQVELDLIVAEANILLQEYDHMKKGISRRL